MRASCLAFCKPRPREISVEKKHFRCEGTGGKRPATASDCGGAERRSQRRLTPFSAACWCRVRWQAACSRQVDDGEAAAVAQKAAFLDPGRDLGLCLDGVYL